MALLLLYYYILLYCCRQLIVCIGEYMFFGEQGIFLFGLFFSVYHLSLAASGISFAVSRASNGIALLIFSRSWSYF